MKRGFSLVGYSLLFLMVCGSLFSQQYVDSFLEARQSANEAFNKGDLNTALKEEKRALGLAQGKYGQFHPSLVPVLNDLATLERYLGQYQDAEKYYKLGLTIREQILGMDDPLVAESLDNLAVLYDDLERDEEAQILEKRALALREGQKGFVVNDSYLRELLQLGKTHTRLKNYEDAGKTLGKAMALANKTLPSGSPFNSEVIEALSDAELGGGHPDLAEADLLKSLELKKARLTENNYEVGNLYKKLGDFYRDLGKKDEGQGYYQKALKVHLRYISGSCDYMNVDRFDEASNDYLALGDHAESLKLKKQVLKTLVEMWGKDDPLTAICQAEIGENEAALGEKDEALSDLQQALGILKDELGPDHTLTRGVIKILTEP